MIDRVSVSPRGGPGFSVEHIIVNNIFSMVFVFVGQCQDVVLPPLVLVHAKRESATAANFTMRIYWPFRGSK